MGSVSKEAMQCLDAAMKTFFDAHTADYKEVCGLLIQRLPYWNVRDVSRLTYKDRTLPVFRTSRSACPPTP